MIIIFVVIIIINTPEDLESLGSWHLARSLRVPSSPLDIPDNLSFTFQAGARLHQEQPQPEEDDWQEQVNDAIQQRAVRHGDPLQERGAG